jgi:hypothetical protein
MTTKADGAGTVRCPFDVTGCAARVEKSELEHTLYPMALLASEAWASARQFSAGVSIGFDAKPVLLEVSIAAVSSYPEEL